jgi:hypothetical protein
VRWYLTYDSNILPGVLAGLALAMHLIVETGHSHAERLDTSGWAVLAARVADVDGLGSGKAALDIILYLMAQSAGARHDPSWISCLGSTLYESCQ